MLDDWDRLGKVSVAMNQSNDPTEHWTIGRSQRCQIIIAAVAVSNQHARITAVPSGYLLEDLQSTNGTYVNGRKIDAPTVVQPGDQITFGQKTPFDWALLSSSSSASGEAESPGGDSSLQPASDVSSDFVFVGDHRAVHATAHLSSSSPTTHQLSRSITIGRDPDSDLVLEKPTISWRHAQVTINEKEATIEDLGSANGVFVGSPHNRVSKSSFNSTDTIYLGSFPLAAASLFMVEPRFASGSPPSHGRRKSNTGSPDVPRSDFPSSDLHSNDADTSVDQPDAQPPTIEAPIGAFAEAKRHFTVELGDKTLILGRDGTCDHVLDHPMISRHHARITVQGQTSLVEDLGSRNGTFVNGHRISRPTVVSPGDTLTLGCFLISLSGEASRLTLTAQDTRDSLSIEARNVTVSVKGKKLVENVSLTIKPGEFVGLMGPSGAGKSTLMSALNGYVQPAEGAVLIDGRSLHQNFDQFRGQIGYVPQDDIMHRDLTVYQALYFTARLRFPPDHSKAEIDRRIDEVLEQLGLNGARDIVIGSPEKKGISGGQRKRVNLAMELLTDPSILYLDEPTSGLSSEDALMVMQLLRNFADRGKTILLTIHQPGLEAYRLMDHLVLIAKDSDAQDPGCLGYFGPAYPDAIQFFNPDGAHLKTADGVGGPDDILRGLSKKRSNEWRDRYLRSKYREIYVTARQGEGPAGLPPIPARRHRELGLQQSWTLLRRNLTLKLFDRANTALLLCQAPVIAVLVAIVFGAEAGQSVDRESWLEVSRATATSLFLLSLASLWCGCSNSIREIVGERAIYHRERMVNLKIPSYLLSKLALLLGFSIIQSIALLSITCFAADLDGPWFAMLMALILASLLGVAIGLLISALAPTSEFAIAMLPLVILPMVMLGGILQPLADLGSIGRAAAAATPSRWSFESILLMEASAKEKWDADWNEMPANSPESVEENQGDDASKENQQPAPREDGIEAGSDMAEPFFPIEEHRQGITVTLSVIAAMTVSILAIVGITLRLRDSG